MPEENKQLPDYQVAPDGTTTNKNELPSDMLGATADISLGVTGGNVILTKALLHATKPATPGKQALLEAMRSAAAGNHEQALLQARPNMAMGGEALTQATHHTDKKRPHTDPEDAHAGQRWWRPGGGHTGG